MEYMRTLLRDNELFRTYVTVSPPGSPNLHPEGLGSFCISRLLRDPFPVFVLPRFSGERRTSSAIG